AGVATGVRSLNGWRPSCLLFHLVVCWANSLLEAPEAERPRLISADDGHARFWGNAAFHPQGPINGIDQQAAQSFAEQVLRGAHGGRKHPDRLAVGVLEDSGPGHRHHGSVFFARQWFIRAINADEYLSHDDGAAL